MEPYALNPHSELRASSVARVIAHLIDCAALSFGTIIGGAFGTLVAAGMLDKSLPKLYVESQVVMGLGFGITYWFAVLWFLNFGVLQGLRGSSIGKAAMHLCVVDTTHRPIGVFKSTLRSMLYSLSYFTFGLGFISAFLDSRQRAWHDQFLKTRVLPLNCLKGPYGLVTKIAPNAEPHDKAA